ncbi:GPP34 family phosphoprotein [Streptantibioticus rubrisoli]|uniref:GPP34 family phosphoprotein n=1 Tax=Streptantibioticus rubrisoli TaxID=1387313 RepID=A0ABT1P6K0_9ACTN|nr:GPP34 family phosphoprotein [Streptantibioticus rubrisoli]MCQ4041002.1 GPP34 family phosphoprotein [Streptantibioticus rubrisoli]
MTTPRDLFIVSMDIASDRPVERGDLSLALAGAEVIDLLAAQAVSLDGDRIVPLYQPTFTDRLLEQAASSLVRDAPYESVSDWLWRRGRDLSSAYLADFEAEGQITRQRRHRWLLVQSTRLTLVDSPARRRADDRWASDEPVLVALAAAIGVHGEASADSPGVTDESVLTVLDAVDDALQELATERQRRVSRLEKAAQDNRQRGW